MRVVGLDPGSTYTGAALARREAGARLGVVVLELRGVRLGVDAWTGVDVGLRAVLEPWRPFSAIGIEQAPPTARSDVNHGHQAALGWKQGYLSGLMAMVGGIGPLLCLPSEWRATMLEVSRQAGYPMSKPGRGRRPSLMAPCRSIDTVKALGGGLLMVTFSCQHQITVDGLASLEANGTRCPRCMERERRVDPATEIRDAWKRLACDGMAYFFPRMVGPLVADARSRARDKTKEPWQLAGVSDACEAGWIAIHTARNLP